MTVDVMGFLLAGTYTALGVVKAMDNDSFIQLGASLIVGSVLGYGAYLNSKDPPRPLFQLSTELLLAGIMGTRYTLTSDVNDGALFLATAASAFYNSYTYTEDLSNQIDIDDFLGRVDSRKITIKIPDIKKAME
ncbi:transmembrane protein 14 homolog [Bactrocera neohumeralis]|uniref:transmembrane protein 14 homolog n=1 Tax=Bactrocera tryoni TaxID=59916 RepID=UPI001A972353|nr:transmembrane protein 14 homolog [Bactrocera tryoni]XP_039957465.1 transmembrane protein 14 homolog [Bactrocera tryoni]XP_039957466.1 transmembrane protein 14 homolog [Bactrocera tryoni]XP_050327659.1 transmembrane protein 14 homolog [Bactrocera neohumeralis]XP_050327660.1 transmembrane protein 14 homolog [Bactrocera neohumeralis]